MNRNTVPDGGAGFRGVSRSYTTLSVRRPYAKCRSCGSSLAGRLEGSRTRRVQGVVTEVQVYACRCGAKRHVCREVAAR